MRLWGTMKQQAGKVAFEAEKTLRIKREESAISGLKTQIENQCTAIGKAVLGLVDEGSLDHPQLLPFVQQIAGLKEQIKATEAKIALIQAEEYVGEAPAPAAPVAPAPVATTAAEPAPAESAPAESAPEEPAPDVSSEE